MNTSFDKSKSEKVMKIIFMIYYQDMSDRTFGDGLAVRNWTRIIMILSIPSLRPGLAYCLRNIFPCYPEFCDLLPDGINRSLKIFL